MVLSHFRSRSCVYNIFTDSIVIYLATSPSTIRLERVRGLFSSATVVSSFLWSSSCFFFFSGAAVVLLPSLLRLLNNQFFCWSYTLNSYLPGFLQQLYFFVSSSTVLFSSAGFAVVSADVSYRIVPRVQLLCMQTWTLMLQLLMLYPSVICLIA